MDLRLSELPNIPIRRETTGFAATAPIVNGQSAAVFAGEAARVEASMPNFVWRTPSMNDPDRRLDVPSAIPDPEAIIPADITGGGRARGVVIHKLIEELLSGELAEVGAAVRARASTLLTQLNGSSDATEPDPAECASTAMDALALPAVAEMRCKLIVEWPIYATAPDGPLVAGRVDAVAVGDEGEVEMVLDWKSDLEPGDATKRDHVVQMSDYLEATGAPRGAVVYVSRSEILWVYRDRDGREVPE